MFVETKSPGEAPATQTPSLEGFVEWLEKQDPNQAYEFWSSNCAVGQYIYSLGLGWLEKPHVLIRLNEPCHKRPWTFGAALQRARAIKP